MYFDDGACAGPFCHAHRLKHVDNFHPKAKLDTLSTKARQGKQSKKTSGAEWLSASCHNLRNLRTWSLFERAIWLTSLLSGCGQEPRSSTCHPVARA